METLSPSLTIVGESTGYQWIPSQRASKVKPVCNDHLYNKIRYLLFIQ